MTEDPMLHRTRNRTRAVRALLLLAAAGCVDPLDESGAFTPHDGTVVLVAHDAAGSGVAGVGFTVADDHGSIMATGGPSDATGRTPGVQVIEGRYVLRVLPPGGWRVPAGQAASSAIEVRLNRTLEVSARLERAP